MLGFKLVRRVIAPVAIVAGLLLATAACNSSDQTGSLADKPRSGVIVPPAFPLTTTASTSNHNPELKPIPRPQTVAVGAPITFTGRNNADLDNYTETVTVYSVQPYHDPTGELGSSPGKMYLIADIGDSTSHGVYVPYNALYFTLRASDGTVYKSCFGTASPDYNYGVVNVGQPFRGFVTFEVPTSVQHGTISRTDRYEHNVANWMF